MFKEAPSTNSNSANNGNISTIIVADDHPLVRKALKNLIENQPDLKLIAEASDGEEAVELSSRLLPNVVIMDITMPKLNGLEATRQIKSRFPDIKVLVLTVYNDDEHIYGILEAGAAGYLTKSVFDEEVVAAIRAVIAGENVLSPPVLQKLLKKTFQSSSKSVILSISEKLNSRELEILKMAARGCSNKDIALKLNLSLPTIKGYSGAIFSKLGVSSRTEAVVKGLRLEILTLTDLE